ncbi:MAG: hypothetical protein AAGD25_27555 [Cyanobacteria bacterium P01_F01_bin.150]
MNMPPILTKLCAASLFVGVLVSLDLIFSQSAYAGCGSYSASGWSVDTLTEETIETFDVGEITECGNVSGSFASFRQEDQSFGWSICYQNCVEGWQANVLYILVNDTREVGEVINLGDTASDGLCVQQSDSHIQYCWE